MGRRVEAVANRVNLVGLVTAVGLASFWEATVVSGLVTYQFLPAPTAIVGSLVELLASGVLLADLAHTVTVTLIGWTTAAVVGITLGTVLGLSGTAYRYSITSFEVVRAVPPITLVPAALLVFGFSVFMELVVVVYAGAWPLLMNTLGGVRGVPDELVDLGRMLRLPRRLVVRKIFLPAALPSIVVGLRLALSFCLVLAVVAEMVGNPAGLGNGLISAQLAIQPERMFAYVLTTGVVGVTLNSAFRAVAAGLLPASDNVEAQS